MCACVVSGHVHFSQQEIKELVAIRVDSQSHATTVKNCMKVKPDGALNFKNGACEIDRWIALGDVEFGWGCRWVSLDDAIEQRAFSMSDIPFVLTRISEVSYRPTAIMGFGLTHDFRTFEFSRGY